jgi:hypothetical protein
MAMCLEHMCKFQFQLLVVADHSGQAWGKGCWVSMFLDSCHMLCFHHCHNMQNSEHFHHSQQYHPQFEMLGKDLFHQMGLKGEK